jgi:unsaturated rhamnogalacturonyl hydrolase
MRLAHWSSSFLLIAIAGVQTVFGQPARGPDVSFFPVRETAIGVTRQGTEITAWVPKDVGRLQPNTARVLVIGGHDGSPASVKFVKDLSTEFAKLPQPETKATDNRPLPEFSQVAFIPNVYPDGPPAGVSAADLSRGYPPSKGYYDAAERPESRYLWRWAAMYGANLVIDVRVGKEAGSWGADQTRKDLGIFDESQHKPQLAAPPEDDFVRRLSTGKVEDMPPTPAFLLQITPQQAEQANLDPPGIFLCYAGAIKSPAREDLGRRQSAAATQIVQSLTPVYGHDLKQVAYIPALAVIGRLRASEQFKDVRESKSFGPLLGPFRFGERNPIPKSGSDQAGHLLFAEMAKRSEGKDRERWIQLCRAAADQIFDKEGQPLKIMPFHNEMSDAVFMATPIICATGKLTGEQKYFDAAVTHFRSMKKLCLRDDGLYRHSPLDEAAWGRGNGFPAMGLAWALSEFPEDHAAFPELKKDFQNHIAALLKHQDVFGCWHQVIDKPGSYREFSATCMIAWALKRGLDRGWLDKATHEKPLERAWMAVKQRIGPKGVIVDICTGTGKQKSLRDYYDRPAIWGVDARGGAMALMLATEMMAEK